MSLNDTPSSDRIHIGLFGNRNAGKSSLINAITSQELAVVSNVKGTTTDPVKKAMELLPLGPVVFIDTPGLDDEGELGVKRVDKALQALRGCQIVVVVIDICELCEKGIATTFNDNIKSVIDKSKANNVSVFIVLNKLDSLNKEAVDNSKVDLDNKKKNHIETLSEGNVEEIIINISNKMNIEKSNVLAVSAVTNEGIYELKESLAKVRINSNKKPLVSDLIQHKDHVVLVIPIDESAPKGRIILPQQQVIRDVLDAGAYVHISRETEYKSLLDSLENVSLVITDSQAFKQVAKETPEDIRLTSFSILMARFKGDLDWQYEGAKELDKLEDGDTILIAEGCTHHRQCNDIGTVKLPNLVKKYSGKKVAFDFVSGTEYPRDLSKYKMVIHCGACTLNPAEMKSRIEATKESKIPITNYGVALAYMNGIIERCMNVFD